ncbi:PREDICTED: serine/arginine repetitive matrix protein 2-like [Vollenhovia emeryi]|uniref:serine/arginine repetitive matrix protein 2-like n=1 Tax=Vollenhovia emeryi TaxID=411798 RepID=UPI0005F3B353|nr:PREDICTED: serine/arginine repetitive matrix protein 2-like [Vollenhovia emeryi]
MPEVADAGLPMDPPPPEKVADSPPPEKKTWDVVTPRAAGTSRASTSVRERSRAREKERSSSRKRTKTAQTPAKNPSPPSPHTPQKTGKSPPRKEETVEGMVDRKIGESFDRYKKWTDRRLQRVENLLQTLVDGGARNSGPAAIPSNPRKGGGGATRDHPVPGADQKVGSGGRIDPPGKAANVAGEGAKNKKRKKKKKAPLSQQTQEMKEAGPPKKGNAGPSQPAADAESYAVVLGRRSRAAEKKTAKGAPKAAAPGSPAKGQAGGAPKRAPRQRLPRTSVVVLTRPNGDYREAMVRLRREVSLKDLGIEGRVNIRSAATGAKIIEVSGGGPRRKGGRPRGSHQAGLPRGGRNAGGPPKEDTRGAPERPRRLLGHRRGEGVGRGGRALRRLRRAVRSAAAGRRRQSRPLAAPAPHRGEGADPGKEDPGRLGDGPRGPSRGAPYAVP